jgi:starch-binding outer membrane protein, SusD/RagB family
MKKIIFISLIIFAISSCNKDILEMTPMDKLSETSVWFDQSLIELFVNSKYHSVEHGFFHLLLWSSLCDESYNIHDGGSYMVQKGELTSDNVSVVGGGWIAIGPAFDYWKAGYSAIRDINIYFSKIDAAPVDDALKTRMNGEMKFIRAFVYANLIWRYGGVPIITNVFELGSDYTVSRSSYDDCVTYICSELDDAIADLPAKEPADQLGRASGDAAKALKSRVLLYAASPLNNPANDLNKWQKAADAADALLNADYSLNSDYQNTFIQDNNEIIFGRYFTQADAYNINLFEGRNGSNGWGSNNPTQNLVDDYEMAATGKLPSDPTSGYDPANPYVGRDPRFYASILYDGALWMGRETETFNGGLDSPQSSIGSWNATLTGYFLKKFVPDNIPPTGSTLLPTAPYIFFRYGEILLNYAEAKFELGDEPTALTYLNMIRSRINMPPITATGDALREKIHHERRIELAFEGHRFFDVRRWKIAMETENKDLLAMKITKLGDGSKTYEIINLLTRGFSEKHYFLPIPRVEIDRSLGSLTQNPGY